MVITIIVITCLVSILAFSKPALIDRLALWPYRMAQKGEWYRLLTHMFVHGGWVHLAINMLVFYSFGSYIWLTYLWLPYRFISSPLLHFPLLYFGGGIVAAAISYLRRRDDPSYVSVGASAGVSAIIFSSITISPWSPVYLFGLVPIPGILMGMAFLIYSWYSSKQSDQHIDHMAHFYGAIYGFLYPMLAIEGAVSNFINQLLHFPSY